MITVKQARRILGKEVVDLSDDDIQQMLNQLYALAEIVLSAENKAGSNK